jgi:putative ABC transport system permease protein
MNSLIPMLYMRFFRWICREDIYEEIQGDLEESFRKNERSHGLNFARTRYRYEVLKLIRPTVIKKNLRDYYEFNQSMMLKTNIKIGWRQLSKNLGYSLMNIVGLGMGMAVAILIGLWIHDELSFNKYHKNYSHIACVMQHTSSNGHVYSSSYQPIPLYNELKQKYGTDFAHIVISSETREEIISDEKQSFYENGKYMTADAPLMLSLKIMKGVQNGLNHSSAIMLSESLSDRLFGNADPINKIVTINKKTAVNVAGVYEDFPKTSEFNKVEFIAPWDLYVSNNQSWINQLMEAWEYDVAQIYVQVDKESKIENVSNKIKNIINDHLKSDPKANLSDISLHPMSKWHLYEEFKDGINTGGRIQFIWLFSIIGISVLLLACINFMNLSTARSEGRTREVGVRKALGSFRSQLIYQFYTESFLIVIIAFGVSLFLVLVNLSWFNAISDKNIVFPWTNQYFWVFSMVFILITGILAGSYPAVYLSSFNAIRALKGAFRGDRMSALPRHILVVVQFTVSVIFIIGTIIIYDQIQYSKDRPVGYEQYGILSVNMKSTEIHDHFDAVRNRLLNRRAIADMAEATEPVSKYGVNIIGLEWRGKDPGFSDNFGAIWVSPEYGNTIGWKIIEGRDFSRDIINDRSALIINKASAKSMGLENPIGEIVRYNKKDWTIIGVVNDIIAESPYQAVRPSVYMLSPEIFNVLLFKLNPLAITREALDQIQKVFAEFAPGMPFNYQFADQQYAAKFSNELRIGKLSTVFAILAILISCLGLFGLATFMAEKRTKEIGIRKVMGASAFAIMKLLSGEFIALVAISCLFAIPVAYYFLAKWLERFQYRTTISWWILIVTCFGAVIIAVLTISFQAIRAAVNLPVKSLRSE